MKVLAIIGSPRKGQTVQAVSAFEGYLKVYGDIEFTSVYLKDLKLEPCKGCGICLERGEEYCSLHDDRDHVLQLMREAKGIIFATPNYSLQVSGLLKNLLDRLCFIFHRPCFFNKVSLSLVTQGVYGGPKICAYLDEVAEFWGFTVVKGINITAPWGAVNPNKEGPPAEVNKNEMQIKAAAARFYRELMLGTPKPPSLKRVFLFRVVRTLHKYSAEKTRDYDYYKQQGWFEASYYYETKLSIYKRILGAVADKWISRQALRDTNKNSST